MFYFWAVLPLQRMSLSLPRCVRQYKDNRSVHTGCDFLLLTIWVGKFTSVLRMLEIVYILFIYVNK